MDEIVAPALRSLVFSVLAVAIAAVPALPIAVALGRSSSRRARVLLVVARVGVATPSVVVGLLVYAMLTRYGPLGRLGLLYSPTAIILGETLLAFPMLVALGAAAVQSLDPRFHDTVRSLRLGPLATGWLALTEARDGVVAAVLAAFARCVTELGVALLVGGNLAGAGLLRSTRTMTSAIATEVSRGDHLRALWLGGVLELVAAAVILAMVALARPRLAR